MNSPAPPATTEHVRLLEDLQRRKNWKRWGNYLSDRQWGTVREDYSRNGDSWRDFPHEHARSRAYRWGEDGLLGLTDRQCRLCFSVSLWNGNDSILKERLFGLTGPEGNHGEDVKELYYFLDATPTHSYTKAMYRYPQAAYPYEELVRVNRQRGYLDREYELLDTGIFDKNRFFDVTMTYAKAEANDILIKVSITNHGPETHEIDVLPTLWFRNTWVWGCRHEGCTAKPSIVAVDHQTVATAHDTLEPFRCRFEIDTAATSTLIFTENETNFKKLVNGENYSAFTKDAFHRYVIDGEKAAVNSKRRGTKVAAPHHLRIESGQTRTIKVRLTAAETLGEAMPSLGSDFDATISLRQNEADEFYHHVLPETMHDSQRAISRQAYAGLLWTKQFYHYIVKDWLMGDVDVLPPPPERNEGRNHDWKHLYARDILSMPDKWEYPWFAAWDLAFHMIPAARIDPVFAKKQLMTLMREWYMHPSGQLPAYEFDFGDVNPPVHAWACLRVFQMEAEMGYRDTKFLSQAFQRLLLNFTWWVNRVDGNGDNVFAGGFLGLDNIGVFDRSRGLPSGAQLEQADGTAWMAFYCGTMLSMALELSRDDPAYADMASKFLDHFIRIVDAMNTQGQTGLWDEADGFYYDQLQVDHQTTPLKVRSLVGLLPLIAVEVIDEKQISQLPTFKNRLAWFLNNRHDLMRHISFAKSDGRGRRMLISIPSPERLRRVLTKMLDESEFLSDYGIRSLSKFHSDHPFEIEIDGTHQRVGYVPGESTSGMFGGNSNWRGPIWFPINYLLIEALHRYDEFYGVDFKIECPTGSGNEMTLAQVADEINRRLSQIFLCDKITGTRPCLRGSGGTGDAGLWQDQVLFYEYFHGDTGEGLGASHQTGWTALIATCLEHLHGRVTEGVPVEDSMGDELPASVSASD